MYGLPKNVDLTFFKGQEITDVLVNKHSLVVSFTDAIVLTLSSKFASSLNGFAPSQSEELHLSACHLLPLIGIPVLEAEGKTDGTLTLKFVGGDSLVFFDDAKNYESYTISHKSTLVIIV